MLLVTRTFSLETQCLSPLAILKCHLPFCCWTLDVLCILHINLLSDINLGLYLYISPIPLVPFTLFIWTSDHFWTFYEVQFGNCLFCFVFCCLGLCSHIWEIIAQLNTDILALHFLVRIYGFKPLKSSIHLGLVLDMALGEGTRNVSRWVAFSTPFVAKTVLSLLNILGTIAKNHLTTYVRIYSGHSHFFFLLDFLPVLHCFDRCSW